LFTYVPDDQLIVLATQTVTPSTDKTKKVDEEANAKYEKDNKVIRGHLFNHMTYAIFDDFFFLNKNMQRKFRILWNQGKVLMMLTEKKIHGRKMDGVPNG